MSITQVNSESLTGLAPTLPAAVDRAEPSAQSRAKPPVSAAIATGMCAAFAAAALILERSDLRSASSWALFCWIAAYATGGAGPAVRAVASVAKLQPNVDVLMILAAAGAAAIGDWLEGGVLLFLFSLSGALEAFAMYRTTSSIDALVKLRPREATLVQPNKQERRVPVDSLAIDNLVRVKPGEQFPIDGIVVEGQSYADESMLTGESLPVHKPVGALVFAGAMNGQGNVLVRMTRSVQDSTVQRIIDMVQTAQSQKTSAQRFVESWQRPYVVGVIGAAALMLGGSRLLHTSSWYDAFYHAMVLLVAASPCAVVVGPPAVMLSAIARAARNGVLFKGAVTVEALSHATVMAFDKTGTLTVGQPRVVEIWTPDGVDATRLLTLAASLEQRSEHPLGNAILEEFRRRRIPPSDVSVQDFDSHTGHGVHARIGDVWIGVGRESLFADHRVALPSELLTQAAQIRAAGQTALIAATDHPGLCGVIAVADTVRPESAAAVAALKRLGIRQCLMLTGDHLQVGQAIAAQVHVDEVRAGLLPGEKVAELRRIAESGEEVVMVGDGINDAPALAAASVGVAMGGAGTDVALETADIVLMRDDLRTLPLAMNISRIAHRRVRQNLIFAFSVIGVLVSGALLDLPLWLGVLGHEGSTVLVVLNGVRLLWERLPE